MRIARMLTLSAALLLLSPPAVDAQVGAEPQPGVLVVSQNICDPSRIEEMNDWMRSTGGPVANELVSEGALIGWGILNHAWGDEWNAVNYWVARDIPSFHRAFGQWVERVRERDPDVFEQFGEWCSAHRDNIYHVVMTEHTQLNQAEGDE